MKFFRPAFDKHRNRVHVISLSCNPVPPERYGGIELVVAGLCEALASSDANVTCYSPGPLNLGGVEHQQTLPVPSPPIKDGGVPNSPEHLQRVLATLLDNSRAGDVVVFNHPDHYRFLKKRLLLRRFGLRLCEVAHWVDVGMQRNVIYPAKALRDSVGRPGIVIPHGVKLRFVTEPVARGSHLFFAGRITADKGVHIALEACRELGVPLYLAGPLNEPRFGKKIVDDPQTKYLGELRYEELVPCYAAARALVYMTQYVEPFGLSVVEAMAAGSPVLTTGKGGTGETVIEGKTGYFCQTATDLVAAYRKLDAIDSAECIARAREYTIERMATDYLQYFATL